MTDDIPEILKATSNGAGESDAERETRYQRAIDEALAVSKKPVLSQQQIAIREAPARFSLRELMLLTTLLAGVLGLIRGIGIYGGLITFVLAVIWTRWLYPYWYPREPRRQATMFDATWGLLMPLVCLACDPFVFRDSDLGFVAPLDFKPKLRPEATAAYCFILWQMLFLSAWLVGRGWFARFAGLFLGTFAVAAIFTVLLSIALVVPALIGTVMGIGLMGFTPMFTSYVYLRRTRETFEMAHEGFYFVLLATIGFFAAIVVPLQIAAWLQPFVGGKPPQFF